MEVRMTRSTINNTAELLQYAKNVLFHLVFPTILHPSV